jgi:hypothetical protein
MRTINGKFVGSLLIIAALTASLTGVANAQLQFIASYATDEGAVHLAWVSQPHELYQIQYASELNTNWDGTTAWQVLYDNYPSQGTTTFWLDTGNYENDPIILHPKSAAMRFYRIVDLGADTASSVPTISISSPTSGAIVANGLTITVSAATDQAVINTKLYVDGQEMQLRLTGTNHYDGYTNYITDTYVINTCEWGNGQHILFATAETELTPLGLNNAPQPLMGHNVSARVPITFSNLITRVLFSQYFFDPDSGQTQNVSAVFAANCDWSLNVINASSNVVRTATGSGPTLLFNWDGNDGTDTAVPAGVYHYVIAAQRNGQPYKVQGSGGGTDTNGPPSPMFASRAESTELYALPPDGNCIVPLVLYPPSYDTNGFTIFEASSADVMALNSAVLMADTPISSNGGAASPDYSGPASETTIAPSRPPTLPVTRVFGTVGIGYQTYASWTNDYAPASPDNGLRIGVHIQMEDWGGNNPISYHAIPPYEDEAKYFSSFMATYSGWRTIIRKANDNLTLSDLQGSSSTFNQVNFGMLCIHGTYGTSPDYAANQCKQMYFPIASGGGATYLRMSEMNLGGANAGELKWMAIMACYSMYSINWQNMRYIGIYPYNGYLHLLLGCHTTEFADKNMLAYFARYMGWGITNNSPMQVRTAWYQAAKDAYAYYIMADGQTPLEWAVAGDNACYYDMLTSTNTPSGSWFYEKTQVWPYQ